MLEDCTNVNLMLLKEFGEYEYVIKIDENIQKISANIIHQCLKDSRGISKTKQHHQIFKLWYSNHAAFLFYFILFYVILHIDIDR